MKIKVLNTILILAAAVFTFLILTDVAFDVIEKWNISTLLFQRTTNIFVPGSLLKTLYNLAYTAALFYFIILLVEKIIIIILHLPAMLIKAVLEKNSPKCNIDKGLLKNKENIILEDKSEV